MVKEQKITQISLDLNSKTANSLEKMAKENGFKNIESLLEFWIFHAKEGNMNIKLNFGTFDGFLFESDNDEDSE